MTGEEDAMSDKTKTLGAQARQLEPRDRITLVEDVLESLDATDPGLDREWADEAKARLDAFRRGEMSARGIRDIAAKFRPA
jgi:putative addiction module component (TIGR02574 family)